MLEEDKSTGKISLVSHADLEEYPPIFFLQKKKENDQLVSHTAECLSTQKKVTASEALEIAKYYYKEHGNIEVGKIYEVKNMYIVFGKSPNGVRYGSKGISISKDSGNVTSSPA